MLACSNICQGPARQHSPSLNGKHSLSFQCIKAVRKWNIARSSRDVGLKTSSRWSGQNTSESLSTSSGWLFSCSLNVAGVFSSGDSPSCPPLKPLIVRPNPTPGGSQRHEICRRCPSQIVHGSYTSVHLRCCSISSDRAWSLV